MGSGWATLFTFHLSSKLITRQLKTLAGRQRSPLREMPGRVLWGLTGWFQAPPPWPLSKPLQHLLSPLVELSYFCSPAIQIKSQLLIILLSWTAGLLVLIHFIESGVASEAVLFPVRLPSQVRPPPFYLKAGLLTVPMKKISPYNRREHSFIFLSPSFLERYWH